MKWIKIVSTILFFFIILCFLEKFILLDKDGSAYDCKKSFNIDARRFDSFTGLQLLKGNNIYLHIMFISALLGFVSSFISIFVNNAKVIGFVVICGIVGLISWRCLAPSLMWIESGFPSIVALFFVTTILNFLILEKKVSDFFKIKLE